MGILVRILFLALLPEEKQALQSCKREGSRGEQGGGARRKRQRGPDPCRNRERGDLTRVSLAFPARPPPPRGRCQRLLPFSHAGKTHTHKTIRSPNKPGMFPMPDRNLTANRGPDPVLHTENYCGSKNRGGKRTIPYKLTFTIRCLFVFNLLSPSLIVALIDFLPPVVVTSSF